MQSAAFLVFNASAGSGKTFALVKNYLTIILKASRDDAYKNILAITFTNKAVQEMKKRVLEQLAAFSADELPLKSLSMFEAVCEATDLKPEQIKAKSKRIMKNLIHNYASFDITTIDKFTHRVIRAFANDLDLPATFEVSLDTDALLTETVDQVIALAGENEELTRLLVDFSLSKTDDDKSWDVSTQLLEIGRLLMNENDQKEIHVFKDVSISDFTEAKAKMQSLQKELQLKVQNIGKSAFQMILNQGLTKDSFNRGTVFNVFEKVASGQMPDLGSVLNNLQEGNRYAKRVSASEKMAVDNMAPSLIDFALEIQKVSASILLYDAYSKNITPLSLLNHLSQTLAQIQEEQNILSITAFNAIVSNEIQNQPAPFIYEKMGDRYHHFFIDEFQDTSEMQWHNLIPLIDNALASENHEKEQGSLLIVGDPKQSIYRWRGGKAEQLIALSANENPFVIKDKKVENLDTNYRSCAEIVQFNNDFFRFVSHHFQNESYRDLYEHHSFQKSKSTDGGFVSLSFVHQNDFEDEEETSPYLIKLLQIIEDLLAQGYQYSDIAILTRKRAHGILTAQFLMEHSIPLLSSETLLISSSTDVLLLVEILKYLQNNQNKEAKALILTHLSKRLFVDAPLMHHDFILEGMQIENELDFEAWLQTHDITVSFENLRKKSLYEAAEYGVKFFLKLQNTNAFVQYFLDLVLEKSTKTLGGLSDFLVFWETNQQKISIPLPEGNNAVRILTIHKAKGLEFSVVIFPFAEEMYSLSPKSTVWMETDSETIGLPKFLIKESSSMSDWGDEGATKIARLSEEHLLDNINILYVALTRPVEQLYVISSMNLDKSGLPKKNTMSGFFIAFLQQQGVFTASKLDYTFGTAQKMSETKILISNVKEIEKLTAFLPMDAIKIAQRETLMWDSSQQEAVDFGNLMHEIMANIQTSADVSNALQKATLAGLITPDQWSVFEQKINAILQHELLQSFFQTEAKVMNEQTILTPEGHFIKPDRLVQINKNEMMLLDYKTGKPLLTHQNQILNYAKIVEAMGFQVVQKTLVYIDEMNIEVVEVG